MKSKENSKDPDLIDFIMAHPEMTLRACILAFGYKPGSVGKVAKRIRAAVAARKAANSATVDKKLVKEVCSFDALKELAEMAQAWRTAGFGLNSAHVRAAELYLHNTGQTPEAKKILSDIYTKLNASDFTGWTNDELDYYARTGEYPARFAASSQSPSVN